MGDPRCSTVLLEDAAGAWAASIAARAEFGDARLESRLAAILETIARRPLDGFPQATGDPHQAKAIYRFLSNKRFGRDELSRCLGIATATNCANESTIYAVQDTSSVSYSSRKQTEGLGPINDAANACGLHLHSTIAVDDRGIVRGVLGGRLWARPPEKRSRDERKKLPIEQKESFKWIVGMRTARQAFADVGAARRIVHVMDREGDIHDVFEEVGDGEGFIIRCVQNRRIAGRAGKAHKAVAGADCLGVLTVTVPKSKDRPAREAKLELRAAPVTVVPDRAKRSRLGPVALTLIEAREIDALPDVPPIHWRLWTNEPAATVEEVCQVLRGYTFRWRIEEYHLVLKSGCAIEKLELKTDERLAKAILLYAAVAARIVGLRDLGRITPEAPCTLVLAELEWRVLAARFQKQPPAPGDPPPSVREAMCLIGRLGGWLGRRGDGLPGVRTLWRGWRDLALMVAGCHASALLR